MDDSKIQKKSVIVKILECCKSLGRQRKGGDDQHQVVVVPEGYFVVHVGPGKERIVIRTKCLNHPFFKELLDEAECEYGYTCGGPIELPCDVDRFFTVLSEMDHVHSSPMCTSVVASPICGFGKGHAGYRVLTPSRLVGTGRI